MTWAPPLRGASAVSERHLGQARPRPSSEVEQHGGRRGSRLHWELKYDRTTNDCMHTHTHRRAPATFSVRPHARVCFHTRARTCGRFSHRARAELELQFDEAAPAPAAGVQAGSLRHRRGRAGGATNSLPARGAGRRARHQHGEHDGRGKLQAHDRVLHRPHRPSPPHARRAWRVPAQDSISHSRRTASTRSGVYSRERERAGQTEKYSLFQIYIIRKNVMFKRPLDLTGALVFYFHS